MSVTIILEKNDADWLENLMDVGIEKAARFSGGWADHIEHLLAIKAAFDSKAVTKKPAAPRAARRTKEEVESEKKLALCSEHPARTLKKRPTDGCKTCWSEYKRLEPMKYEAAWRAFKAAERKKEAK